MSIKNPNDPKIPDRAAPPRMSTQQQERLGPQIEEEAIPWAEIIFEEELSPVGEEHPMAREPHPADVRAAPGFLSRISGMSEEDQEYDSVAGPPLAVLAVALLVFLLLLQT